MAREFPIKESFRLSRELARQVASYAEVQELDRSEALRDLISRGLADASIERGAHV